MDRDRVYLIDILQAARLAYSYIEGATKEQFYLDVQQQDSVIRRRELVGEAARRVSSATRADHPELPWQEMVGLRNLLIHEYDDVDLSVVWDTVRDELPGLISTLERIIGDEETE